MGPLTPKDQIIALLPKLSAADLTLVVQTAKMLGAASERPKVAAPVSDDWLMPAIVHVLRAKGMASNYDWSRTNSAKHYAAKASYVLEFLTQLEKDTGLGKRDRPALALVAANALVDWLAARNMLSLSTMLSMVDHIPEALEANYPGYVQAGLFRAVLKGL